MFDCHWPEIIVLRRQIFGITLSWSANHAMARQADGLQNLSFITYYSSVIMDNASIKENIIRIRTEKGISQDEMARALGISRNSYRSIEKGLTCLINKRLGEIAKILEAPVEELALGYQPIESEERLEDIRLTYKRNADNMKSATDARIAELERTIASQKETIANLQDLVESKTEIISLLKRNMKEL